MKNTPTPDEQIEMHGRMVAVRHLEERLGELHKAGKTRGPIHRCDGQEAVGIGATAVLRRQDKLASTHRGHGHCIAKGASLDDPTVAADAAVHTDALSDGRIPRHVGDERSAAARERRRRCVPVSLAANTAAKVANASSSVRRRTSASVTPLATPARPP